VHDLVPSQGTFRRGVCDVTLDPAVLHRHCGGERERRGSGGEGESAGEEDAVAPQVLAGAQENAWIVWRKEPPEK